MHNFLQKIVKHFEDYGMHRARRELMRYDSMYRKTYEELSRLTDKELQDIGVSRGMIHSIALESALDNRRVATQ